MTTDEPNSADRPDELSQQFGRDIVELVSTGKIIELHWSAPEAIYVVSALQLALRHPLFPATLRLSVTRIARGLEAQVSLTPAIREVLRRGWHEEFDVPADEDS